MPIKYTNHILNSIIYTGECEGGCFTGFVYFYFTKSKKTPNACYSTCLPIKARRIIYL